MIATRTARQPPDTAHGVALLAKLRTLGFDQHERLAGAEIGVLGGRLSAQLLRELPGLRLLMVDHWLADSGRLKQAARLRTRFAGPRRKMRHGDSVAMAARAKDCSLDFVFVDGDHTYRGVSRDLAAWAPKVRRGGLLCGHDIDSPAGDGLWKVREAVQEFLYRSRWYAGIECGPAHTWFVAKPGA